MLLINLRLDSFFFFNDTATTEIYTLSLHDALPICAPIHRASSSYSGAARWCGTWSIWRKTPYRPPAVAPDRHSHRSCPAPCPVAAPRCSSAPLVSGARAASLSGSLFSYRSLLLPHQPHIDFEQLVQHRRARNRVLVALLAVGGAYHHVAEFGERFFAADTPGRCVHRRPAADALLHAVEAGHDGEAPLHVIIRLGAIPVGSEARGWAACRVLPVVAASQISAQHVQLVREQVVAEDTVATDGGAESDWRSEEHTSELQSLTNIVCR